MYSLQYALQYALPSAQQSAQLSALRSALARWRPSEWVWEESKGFEASNSASTANKASANAKCAPGSKNKLIKYKPIISNTCIRDIFSGPPGVLAGQIGLRQTATNRRTLKRRKMDKMSSRLGLGEIGEVRLYIIRLDYAIEWLGHYRHID